MAGSPTPIDLRQIPIHRGFWRMLSAWLPVLICVAAIATESTPMFGADHTTGPLRRLCEYLFGPISQHPWDTVHVLIRKTGHFAGYGILSLAWLRAFRMSLSSPRNSAHTWIAPHGLAMLGTLLVASSDEIHQTFLPNRTGTFHDVLTDCSGALVMQVAVFLWLKARSNGAEQA